MVGLHNNIKLKIALHSFAPICILSILLILSILFSEVQTLPYAIFGLMLGETLRIIFSKQKYLSTVHENEQSISITYFNRLLIKKQIKIGKEDLEINDVTETNWWYGRLNFINFSNGRENFKFNYIDKSLRHSIMAKLEIE
jgi:hypothetical protein